jgi:hypothetical protein
MKESTQLHGFADDSTRYEIDGLQEFRVRRDKIPHP